MWSNIAVGTHADIIGVQPTYKVSNDQCFGAADTLPDTPKDITYPMKA